MRINGYEITQTGDEIRIEEIVGEQTKSWKAMLEFAARFPTGFEEEWDAFVIKHTQMQKREVEAVMREFLKRVNGHE